MLKELNIQNIAIIDGLRVEFAPGLNVFTGETGAGKSIIVDALNLALGERASTDLIRTGAKEAVVEAAFELNGNGSDEIATLLAERGIEMEDGDDLIVRRVLSQSGKNKVYINGSLANLTTLAALGACLADIHGQHEHQSLLSHDKQMDLLDSFGGLLPVRDALSATYQQLQAMRRELASLEAGERDRLHREDLLRHQRDEIEGAMLTPGEDEALAQELKLHANAEKLAGLSRAADEALYSSDNSVMAGLKKAMDCLKEMTSIDGRVASALELCESGQAQLSEASREVSAYADRVEFDPDRLEAISDRLDLIGKLKKKYGATIDEIIAFGTAAAEELDRMERSTEEITRLRDGIQSVKAAVTAEAEKLTKKRTAAAREMEKKVEAELSRLGMKKTVFTAALTRVPGDDTLDGYKIGPRGADSMEFLIAPNPGEVPKPLAKIASGGELSRIMLALKTVLTEGDGIPTLVFDEVDAGIGGAVAEEVGRKLKRVAAKRQVFCITHLPQIASMATSHYGVAKSVKKDRTSTEVRRLDHDERVKEIARMLGGKTITDASLTHAEELIERGRA